MTDEIFVKDAAKRWQALLKAMENKDTATMALGVSLWATMNVDRLLKIAGQRAGGPDA